MKLLSRSEEIILLAVWRLRENAYGVTIREQVSKATGHDWPFGAIYVPLDKLTKKRYVRKTMGEPTSERGGRRKCLYELTSDGRNALKSIRQVQDDLWDGIPDYAFD
ncbi:MAG: PadR family transcriptional regulator [bacterium]|nr:PadR family transcriptional regulator [bacterium]